MVTLFAGLGLLMMGVFPPVGIFLFITAYNMDCARREAKMQSHRMGITHDNG
jgi:hypothetical protein